MVSLMSANTISSTHALQNARPPVPSKGWARVLLWFSAFTGVAVLCFLGWGSNLLIASDPLPDHVDGVVVLQGSMAAEKARLSGAIELLLRGTAAGVLLSVPRESYWGQPIAPPARSYIERNYGGGVSARVKFCQTGPEVDSTAQEAEAIGRCLHEAQWHTVAVVTSNYHTRRARMIWRKAMARQYPGVRIWIDGVADPDFQQPWWRSRRSAKIWLMESSKLVVTLFGG
jgi:uncharacterized SAM-binding protein YcdF (DUF218 family)